MTTDRARYRPRRSDNVLEFPAPAGAPALACDRAAVVTTAVLATICNALRDWIDRGAAAGLADVRAEIEALLREEFADVAHTTIHEIRREDG